MSIEAIPLTTPSLCLKPGSTQLQALQLLLEHGVNHAPVCEGDVWVGMVTIHDLLGAVLPASARVQHGLTSLRFVGDALAMLTAHVRDMRTRDVKDLVRRKVPTLRREQGIMEAALLLHRHCMPLPVLDQDGRLLGMLSARALMQYLSHAAGD
jgi:CBS domain-containing protein